MDSHVNMIGSKNHYQRGSQLHEETISGVLREKSGVFLKSTYFSLQVDFLRISFHMKVLFTGRIIY